MHFLAAATAWVEQQQTVISAQGRRLSHAEQALAKAVGVAQPQSVYVLEVPVITRPDNAELAAICDQFGFLTEDTIGLTLGYGIYIKQGYLTPRLLSHELRHVHQYEQAGSAQAFLSRYITEVMQFGYLDAPYEIDARSQERESLL